jgi:putative heme-binding domain-containing protein
MKKKLLKLVWLFAAVSFNANAADDAGFKSIFNGKNLAGWDGESKLWSVQDGAITGVTTDEEPLAYNKFIIWRGGVVKNFELRAQFRLFGKSNSGIQYRSKEAPDRGDYVVVGYQADIHPSPANNVMLYDEQGRGILANHGQKMFIGAKGEKMLAGSTGPVQKADMEDWNELTIIARGNHIIHKLNGKTTIDLIDHHKEERELEGILAFQVHRGPAMKIQFKNIRLKTLPDGGVLSLAQAPIPADAKNVSKPKRAPRSKKGGKGKAKAKAKGKPAPAAAKAKSGKVDTGKTTPNWIWAKTASDKQVVYFRRSFSGFTPRTASARLYASCDNQMQVFINGVKVIESGAWEQPVFKDVVKQLQRGQNVIAIRASNSGSAAGLIAKLILDSDREPIEIVTDGSWKLSEKPVPGWNQPKFDDSKWISARIIGPLGAEPWKRMVNETTLYNAVLLKAPGATPVESLNVKEGFKVELLHTVPKGEQGSWVSMCVDDKGRLIVSDQYGGLYRVTTPPLKHTKGTKVEKIDVDMGHAQGLLYAFDSLYVVVNDKAHGGRGLYRVRDTNGDDKFDQVELLKKFEESGGEHGPHAVVLGPDKKSLYVVVGNQTQLPEGYNVSRVPEVWGEDQLLPRIYGRGFMKGAQAPRGWIAKTDKDGKQWEIMATGFRNEYDAAFNRHGELFTYDADMEWDLNTPWYRPTRVCQVVSGAEFGWRNGSAKFPVYYPDSVPPTLDIGPGSPTGVAFGYGAKFPAKYQDAFYIADWSYGKLYAVHLKPKGAGYTGEVEEFITGSPLPLTDLVVNPKDKAMYFAIGGRRVQSALYRVTYAGDESTKLAKGTKEGAELRQTRRALEAFHGKKDPKAVAAAWPQLSHSDRLIRYAARVAIEHQNVAAWQDKALAENETRASLAGLLALTRVGDKSLQPKLLAALDRLDWGKLKTSQRLELIRIYSLAFIRMGEPDAATRERLASRLDACLPVRSPDLNHELLQLLVYLQSGKSTAKGVQLLSTAATQEDQINYAKSLRLAKTGWTMPLRKQYFEWFPQAANFRGGASFSKFVESIKNDAVKGLSAAEKAELKPVLDAAPVAQTSAAVMAAMMKIGDRGSSREWKVDELARKAEAGLKGRDFDRGRAMFGAVACFSCHRFDGRGGIVGPDLTQAAGRFSARDLLESIIEPNKEISDQYGAVVITKLDGSTVTGRIANLSGDRVSLITNMFDPGAMEGVDRKQIESQEPSKISMMPGGLINLLTEDEIMDLLAYVLSRGDADHAMFK